MGGIVLPAGSTGASIDMSNQNHLTTLCYIEKDGCYLMMHRIRKANDLNEGKWVGIGGHFEEGEGPEECLVREVKEETGLVLTSYRFRGIVTFVSDEWGTEYMTLFTADGFEGEITDDQMNQCEEGILAWVPKEEVVELPIWEGDLIFLKMLLEEEHFFTLKLIYEGDRLVKHESRVYDEHF